MDACIKRKGLKFDVAIDRNFWQDGWLLNEVWRQISLKLSSCALAWIFNSEKTIRLKARHVSWVFSSLELRITLFPQNVFIYICSNFERQRHLQKNRRPALACPVWPGTRSFLFTEKSFEQRVFSISASLFKFCRKYVERPSCIKASTNCLQHR